MTNKEYAQKILRIIGNVTVSSDAIYQLAKEAYHKLGGSETEPDLNTIYQYLKAAIDIYDETVDLNITENGTYELLGKTINVDVEATPNEPFKVQNNLNDTGYLRIYKYCPTAIIEYSRNGEDWFELGANQTGLFSIYMYQYQVVFFRGIMDESVTNLTTAQFTFFENQYIRPVFYGNIMNLYDYRNPENKTLKIPYCFASMFANLDFGGGGFYVTLPATTLSPYCYRYILSGQQHLNTTNFKVPELPATTLAEGCYYGMFQGIGGFQTTPKLPATTLAPYCYSRMFSAGSMINEIELPATTLAPHCYEMLFYYSANITKVTINAQDISAENCLNNWMEGVGNTGDFYNLGGATYPIGKSGIPTGWTEHTSL